MFMQVSPPMSTLTTRASSINRALDQIGDKWCLLILEEVLWGINTFTAMLEATGVSRGVLSNRLQWLQSVDCLQQTSGRLGARQRYRLTRKSEDIYQCALMALNWEREFFSTPELDGVVLTHSRCGHAFIPTMQCRSCKGGISLGNVSFKPGPGATVDERSKKVRRRSSISIDDTPSQRILYRNLVNIVGDRWTANVIALAFHGLHRFDGFHRELPVATNILASRLKFLVEQEIFEQVAYQHKPLRHEYRLTARGEGLFPWFLALQQWGDKWCDPEKRGKPVKVVHHDCNKLLHAEVVCSQCGEPLNAREVDFDLGAQLAHS